MRFSSSKAHVAQHGTSTPSNASKSNSPTPNDLNYKKDGSLDMRYKSSKQYVLEHPEAVPAPKQNKKSIAPPSYENDLKLRKDGFLDMRTKVNKQYAALPRDSNGNVIQNSPEAKAFRKEHALEQPPSMSFDFNSLSPISYVGPNVVVREVLRKASHYGTKQLGKMTLFHATTKSAADSIMKSKVFRPGKGGMFGAAMYFADNKKAAMHKAAHGVQAIITANVKMGKALVVEGPKYDLTAEQIKELGCDTVFGRSSPSADWEYVVYDPSRIEPFLCEYVY